MERREIATQILAGMAANSCRKIIAERDVTEALRVADQLIALTKAGENSGQFAPTSPS